MVELIVFVLGVMAIIVIAVWVGFTVVVLVASIPAIGLAVGLTQLGMSVFWSAVIGLVVYGTAMGLYLERRERRKTEPKRPGRGGLAGAQAAETARRTRARLASR